MGKSALSRVFKVFDAVDKTGTASGYVLGKRCKTNHRGVSSHLVGDRECQRGGSLSWQACKANWPILFVGAFPTFFGQDEKEERIIVRMEEKREGHDSAGDFSCVS